MVNSTKQHKYKMDILDSSSIVKYNKPELATNFNIQKYDKKLIRQKKIIVFLYYN